MVGIGNIDKADNSSIISTANVEGIDNSGRADTANNLYNKTDKICRGLNNYN